MKSYVDIEGAGRDRTVITAPVDEQATVTGANSAELRNLTVICSGGEAYSIGVAIRNEGVSPTIRNVQVSSYGASNENIGILNNDGAPQLIDLKIWLITQTAGWRPHRGMSR